MKAILTPFFSCCLLLVLAPMAVSQEAPKPAPGCPIGNCCETAPAPVAGVKQEPKAKTGVATPVASPAGAPVAAPAKVGTKVGECCEAAPVAAPAKVDAKVPDCCADDGAPAAKVAGSVVAKSAEKPAEKMTEKVAGKAAKVGAKGEGCCCCEGCDVMTGTAAAKKENKKMGLDCCEMQPQAVPAKAAAKPAAAPVAPAAPAPQVPVKPVASGATGSGA